MSILYQILVHFVHRMEEKKRTKKTIPCLCAEISFCLRLVLVCGKFRNTYGVHFKEEDQMVRLFSVQVMLF